MYQGKSKGRDQIVVYQPDLVLAERERLVQVQHLDELRRVNEELTRQTRVDELTGVANLRAYRERLVAIDAQARQRGSVYSVLFCDIDLFGPYNKRWGELAGDAALQAVAAAINATCRRHDEMFRRGGEELVVLLPDTDEVGAAAMAERVRAAVEDLGLPHLAATSMDTVTISVGVATLDPERHQKPEAVESDADQAMVGAKRAGRNRWLAGGAAR